MPPKKQSLEELISHKQITFHSYGRKLKTTIKDFGEYNWNLITHVVEQAGNKITLSGDGLEKYLRHLPNMYVLADFVIQIWAKGTERYHQEMAVCVAVNIDVLNPHYLKQRKMEAEKIVNGFGQVVGETSSWLSEMPYVEKVWNFALCNAVGGLVGSPGDEYPRDEKSFFAEIAHHAQHYMIGTPKQVKRYEQYALKNLELALAHAKKFEENPRLLFENPYDALLLARAADDARRIAENVVCFGKDWK